jgi:hypothetical protein
MRLTLPDPASTALGDGAEERCSPAEAADVDGQNDNDEDQWRNQEQCPDADQMPLGSRESEQAWTGG